MSSGYHWSGYLLGFALGGFFDGILLHQILQWHHLLAGLQAHAFSDIRVQILADGLFHALMYLIAALGLLLLWRTRGEFAAARSDRWLFANALIGFGVWHVVDSVFSHWITGIHRIKMDTANPLVWDLIWFATFGIVPLVLGLLMRRGSHDEGTGHIVASVLAAAVFVGGAWSAIPPRNVSQVMVYFGPAAKAETVIAAAAAVDARLIWSDRSGELWALDLSDPSRSTALYKHGALFVGNSLLAVGCLSWSRAI
ncbi:DUF2243 domain-containing protein [Bradyrhizobium sp. WSM 1738]|uniref:DUF2243 domain-containing protein n=1 Tax=Bradyrhizobium hereditatis TaxID=2821405 RepID=UPI001CE38EDC|nr:DUF2243 domain-containing protein [Bradyrhizobium hereditatis]MCA6114342.1 DUF2243 domain-containing protein [Bradyrhizobium hereditatis]